MFEELKNAIEAVLFAIGRNISVKELSDSLGYCSNMKEYKENPDNYKGSVADVSTVIRVVLTSSSMTPDLYELMKLLGITRIKARINKYIEN